MLASLGAGLDGESVEDSGTNETRPASAASGSAGKASPAASSPGSSNVVLLKQGSALEGEAETGITGWSAAGSQTGTSTVQASAGGARQSKANGEETIPEDVRPAESAGSGNTARSTDKSASTRQANFNKDSKQADAADTAATLLASAMAGNIPLAMPAPVNAAPSASAAVEPRLKLPDRSAELPTDDIGSAFIPSTLTTGGTGTSAGRAKSAEKSSTDTIGTASLSGKTMPRTFSGPPEPVEPSGTGSRNFDGSDAPVSAGTKSTSFDEQDALSGRMQARAVEPHSARTQNPHPIEAQGVSQGREAGQTSLAGRGAGPVSAESGQSAAALLNEEKAGMAKGVQSPAPAATRAVHGLGAAEALQHGSHSLAGESTGTALDAAALARDPAGAHGAVNTAHGIAGSATSSAAASTAHETFAALDAETTTGTTTWIHAGAQRAEAGFQDPSLGWVGVRAELGGGGVHAALVPGSADAAQTLGGHLSGLNSYLDEQHTPVATLTMAASADRGSESGVGQGTQQQAGQNNGHGAHSESQTDTRPGPPAMAAVAPVEISAETGRREASDMASGLGGRYVSVMA